MLFSLIVSECTTKEYLEKCLDSIKSQDFKDYEVILVAEGSAGRNEGISKAKGDWLWFIEGDDYIAPGALSSMVERMRFAKGDMYAFQFIKTDEACATAENVIFRVNQESVLIKDEGDLLWNYDNRTLPYKDGWEAFTRLYKRKKVIDNGLKFKDADEVYNADLCFLAEYMMCISSYILLVNLYYYHRQNTPSQKAVTNQNEVIIKLFDLLEDIYKEGQRLGKEKCLKYFDTLCFGVIKAHLDKLSDLTNDEIKSEIDKGTQNKLIGRYVAIVIKRLFDEVDKRKIEQ